MPRELALLSTGAEQLLPALSAGSLQSDQSTVLIYVVAILRSADCARAYTEVSYEGIDPDSARQDNVSAIAVAAVYGIGESLKFSLPLNRLVPLNRRPGVDHIPPYPSPLQYVDTSSWPEVLADQVTADVAQMAGDELPAERVVVALIAEFLGDITGPGWVDALDVVDADVEVVALSLDQESDAVEDVPLHVFVASRGATVESAIRAYLSYAARAFSAMPSTAAPPAPPAQQSVPASADTASTEEQESQEAIATAMAERVRQESERTDSLVFGRDSGSEREAYLDEPAPRSIEGIRSQRVGERVRLLFRWPDACTGVAIRIESGSNSSAAVQLTRSGYERDGCWITIGSGAVRVELLPTYPGDQSDESGALVSAIDIGPATPPIEYDVQRFFGNPTGVTFVARASCTIDRLTVVLAQGVTMPLAASGGAIVVEAESLTFDQGVVVRRPLDQSVIRKARRPFWLAAFADVSGKEFALRPHDVQALKFGRG